MPLPTLTYIQYTQVSKKFNPSNQLRTEVLTIAALPKPPFFAMMQAQKTSNIKGDSFMPIGALEAGGTKMVAGVFSEEGDLLTQAILPTREPVLTMPEIIGFFRENPVDALGIGSFGPLDLRKDSPTYGYITSTPKLIWRDYPLLPELQAKLNIPCAIDTDANAAVLAELERGIAKGLSNAVYVTIGTGVGGGISVSGQLVHGMLHPELGHMLLHPHPDDTNPKGVCPYHEGCLEGLASGPALTARAGTDARLLPDSDPAFALEAYYLAQMCVNLILTVSPERIVLGGGVMQRQCLFPMIRQETLRLLNGYVQHASLLEHIEEYIVPPELFPISGLVGAYLLGLKAAKGG